MARIGLLLLLALTVGVNANVFLQWPPGSNNRLEDGGRDRNNGARLFDSQNNNRGGVNVGQAQNYFYEGSILPVQYNVAHGCSDPSADCTLVLQYTCNENIRNGYYMLEDMGDRKAKAEITIPFWDWDQERYCESYHEQNVGEIDFGKDNNCSVDYRYGQHESYWDFAGCYRRSRNMGLWTGTQRMSGNTALHTRQNRDGNRRGYECPEERDYYPYWQPTVWRDIAIVTSNTDRCAAYQAESQNVKERYICVYSGEFHEHQKKQNGGWGRWGYAAITKEECELAKNPIYGDKLQILNVGVWTKVEPFNIPPPECVRAQHTRNGAISNSRESPQGSYSAMWNWSLPLIERGFTERDAERCIFRIRYNVTNTDVSTYADSNTLTPGLNASHNSPTLNNWDPILNSPANVDVWSKYGFDYATEIAPAFASSHFSQTTVQQVDGKNVISRHRASHGRGWVLEEYPWVDIFGPTITPTKRLYLQLGISTQHTFRVFQDRTHTFALRKRPITLQNFKILNLSVNGKRGNIVQTFPGTEYSFAPEHMEIRQGDLIHIQWNGAITNPKGNAGEGPAGYDRSNMVMMGNPVYEEIGQDAPGRGKVYGQWGRSYPAHLGPKTGPTMEGAFLGLSYEDRYKLSTPALYNSYFDLGLRQITTDAQVGTYHYMSTRNNNFSNRSQKGKIVVLPPTDDAPFVKAEFSFGQRLSVPGLARVRFSYDERQAGQQEVIVEDAGTSKYASNWVRVSPSFLAMPDKGYMELRVEHEWYPLTYGRIYWAECKGCDLMEVKTRYDTFAESGTATAKANVMQGGYYVVKNELNGSGLGGIVVAFLLVTFVVCFFRKRFGCRVFNKGDKDSNSGLIGSGGTISDAPLVSSAAPPPTKAPTSTSD